MTNDGRELLDQAMRLHGSGHFAAAASLYREILKSEPTHFVALSLLGNICIREGQPDEALSVIGEALLINPRSAEAQMNFGYALTQLDRLEEAAVNFRRAIEIRRDFGEAHSSLAMVLALADRLDEAVAAYRRALEIEPHTAQLHNNLGTALARLGRYEAAVASYRAAIEIDHNSTEYHRHLGFALDQLNRREEALAIFQRAVGLEPTDAQAQCGLGLVASKLGGVEEAIASYRRAIEIEPDLAEAHNGLGTALQAQNQFYEAAVCYERAIVLRPDDALSHYHHRIAMLALDRREQALTSCDRAIALSPDFAGAYDARAAVLIALDRLEDALASYDRAIAISPDYAEACNNRGAALRDLGRQEVALASYDRALALKPDYPEAFRNRGVALLLLERRTEALAGFDRAVELKPDFVEAFINRGIALLELGRRTEALASFERAITLRPDHALARLELCVAQLPTLYRAESEIFEQRAAYARCLLTLKKDIDDGLAKKFATAVGMVQPFYLPYQGYNDRDLQDVYGALVCQGMAARYPQPPYAPPPRSGAPIRIGVVSGFFCNHSNWKVPIKGWVDQLDRQRFEIFGYYTGVEKTRETTAAAALCDRFVQGPLSLAGWRSTILHDPPHVLIYPEIGMHPMSAQLAAQRLARMQCNSWGHPVTSGYRTLDYFLDSDLMEPAGGQHHYTERLVRLPNLSIYYEPVDAAPVALERASLGLRPGAVVYWCGQSLYKYLPQYDVVYPWIMREVGDCQFAFIAHKIPQITSLFQDRLAASFGSFGLHWQKYCVFLPGLHQDEFVQVFGQCDIFLDSIGWSGCNTTLESLAHDLPIVTIEGPLMRGRHSAAILRMMGVTETIVETIGQYIAIASRLGREPSWRTELKQRIADHKHRIYRGHECILALEKFLEAAAPE